MDTTTDRREWLATVDVRQLNTIRWGPLRDMFPRFAEEIELSRYLKNLLRTHGCSAVQIERYHDPATGRCSEHIYDVFLLTPPPAEP
jgi:hypothetical protein